MVKSDTGKRVATTRPDSRRGKTKSQIREERRMRSQARKKRRRLVYMSGGSLLAIVFILSLTIGPGLVNNSHGGTGGNINEGGPVPINPDLGGQHIRIGTFGSGYSETPATSGPHWFERDAWELPNGEMVDAPADWGKYDFPLPDEVLIHNLEHGGIGFHYDTEICGDTCDELISQFDDVRPRTQYIISPYAGLEKKIAITSWRHHLYLDEFDQASIEEFIDAYLDRAPESIPYNSFN